MTRRLYLAPIVTLNLNGRTPSVSKVLEYGVLPNVTSIMPNPVKSWCLTTADFDDTQHGLVSADPDIFPIPFAALDNTWADYTPAQRTAIGNKLESLRVPADWIQSGTTVSDLIRHTVRLCHLVQMLKAEYPEVSLDLTFGDLSAPQRNNILAWAEAKNVDTTGLTTATPIRTMLRALVTRFPWNTSHDLPFMRGLLPFSVGAQIQAQALREGRLKLEDLLFSAQVAVSDNFDRADSSDLGANWTEGTGDWEIASNQLRQVTGPFDFYKLLWAGTALSSADHFAEADITTGTSGFTALGVGTRLASGTGDANSDGIAYTYYPSDFSYLSRIDNSAETILDTGSATSSSTTYSNVRLESNGDSHTGTRNGSADTSATDSTYDTGGVGCWAYDGAGTDRIDNWSAEDIVTLSVEQEGYRFRKDDGGETAATWWQAQDTVHSIAIETRFRLRFVINMTSDLGASKFQIQYKRSTDPTAAYRRISIKQ